MAILAGDAMLTYAFEHIARATQGVPAERVLRVIAELGRASGADGLVGGQVVDIQSEGKEVGRRGSRLMGGVGGRLQAWAVAPWLEWLDGMQLPSGWWPAGQRASGPKAVVGPRPAAVSPAARRQPGCRA